MMNTQHAAAVVDVADLFAPQLLQPEAAQGAVAVETGEPAAAGRLQDYQQDVGRVVGVVHLQHRPGDGRRATAALHGQRGEGHDPRRLGTRE
ncbi:hypothetical protein EYF80_056543 [Liparis tanakae]|uniref:Uncharacterized protein n=1 Tax=Liparis tanakae TaxID=230148 RepID=A0A4Z2EWP1_9TELE|nr:hypothetical protein EYF80_056543 [Liparis tanakae]